MLSIHGSGGRSGPPVPGRLWHRERVLSETKALQLIVGLGNPGAEYVMTRHNAGFWFVDLLAQRHGGRWREERKFHGEVCRIRLDGHDLRLLKPMTYMNRSGLAVQAMAAYLKLEPEQILVAHDEIDLPAGAARLKWNGGHGGHNGLRDVSRVLGDQYRRLRLGVGRPANSAEVIDYVLRRPSREEQENIMQAVAAAADVLPLLLEEGMEKAMTRLHSNQNG